MSTELTLKDLVTFDGEEFRLPSTLIQVLTDLREAVTTLRRAHVRLTVENGQRVANVVLKVVPEDLRDPREADRIYEALEGAATSKIMIRAQLLEQIVPYQRSPLLDINDIDFTEDQNPDLDLDDDEAWLLLTRGNLFEGENGERTEEIMDAWEKVHPEPRPRFQYLVIRQGEITGDYQAVELTGGVLLQQARDLAQQLSALDEVVEVKLTVKASVRPRPNYDLYENTREMARRMRQSDK